MSPLKKRKLIEDLLPLSHPKGDNMIEAVVNSKKLTPLTEEKESVDSVRLEAYQTYLRAKNK
jgi:hypothetical protein